MRRRSATSLLAILAATAAALTAGPTAATADEELLPAVSFSVGTTAEKVFDYDAPVGGSCDTSADGDLPDAAARAFRDSTGTVHLIATHYQHWASIGSSLNDVERDCSHLLYAAGNDPDPEDFDDRGWLETFYTEDGETIHALVAMDYHPDHHAGLDCIAVANQCWYGTTVQATSTDGGYSFTSPAQGTPRFVAGPRERFDENEADPLGTFVPSNIVEGPDGALYATLSYELRAVPPNQPRSGGTCLIRTLPENIDDPTAWRAWDGTGYNVAFTNPYLLSVPPPANANRCAPIAGLQRAVRSLLKVEGQDFYLAISHGIMPGETTPSVIAYTSENLRDWSAPIKVKDLPRYGQFGESCGTHGGVERWQYPSLLDPESTSINFNTTGTTAYLYATSITYCNGVNRDLVRWPVTITIS